MKDMSWNYEEQDGSIRTATADNGREMYIKLTSTGQYIGLWRYTDTNTVVPLRSRSAQPCPTFCGNSDGGRLARPRKQQVYINPQNPDPMEQSFDWKGIGTNLATVVAGVIIALLILQQFQK